MAALLLMAAGVFGRAEWKPLAPLLAPDEDGSWAAVSIDARPVSWREYRIAIAGSTACAQ